MDKKKRWMQMTYHLSNVTRIYWILNRWESLHRQWWYVVAVVVGTAYCRLPLFYSLVAFYFYFQITSLTVFLVLLLLRLLLPFIRFLLSVSVLIYLIDSVWSNARLNTPIQYTRTTVHFNLCDLWLVAHSQPDRSIIYSILCKTHHTHINKCQAQISFSNL